MKKNKNASWEVRDLTVDEKETTDISSQHPELAAQFEKILKKEHQPSHLGEWELVNPKFTGKD